MYRRQQHDDYGILHDCPAGRCRVARAFAVRAGNVARHRAGRRLNDHLRHVRRHARDFLGADRQVHIAGERTFIVSLIVLARFDWDLLGLFESMKRATPLQERFLMAGNMFDHPLDMLSFNMALVLGTAGLPHIIARFYTVKDPRTVRSSVKTATFTIGIFMP